jgi:hypothetical protein
MFLCRFGRRGIIRHYSASLLTCLALFWAVVLLGARTIAIQTAHAGHTLSPTPAWTDFNAHDPGILLASGPATQTVVLLLNNPSHVAFGPPCQFSGVVRADDMPPPLGSGLQDLVFEPISLATGESLAIDIPFMPDPDAGVRQDLILRIEQDDAASGPCPLLVQALGYDDDSGATEFMIHDRFALGLERTFDAAGEAGSPRPLGFAGGNANQSARFILVSDNDSPLPAEHCELTGEVTAQTLPRLTEASADQPQPVKAAWPIKWEGPSLRSVAIVDIPFEELGASAEQRVDALLSIRFDHPLSTVCPRRLNGSLQILDQPTGTTRAVIPTDRVLFDYQHFHN